MASQQHLKLPSLYLHRSNIERVYHRHQIDQFCKRSEAAEYVIKQAFERLNLSMRGYHKILKVARTIADIADSDLIEKEHIQEAIMYRSLDQMLEKMR